MPNDPKPLTEEDVTLAETTYQFHDVVRCLIADWKRLKAENERLREVNSKRMPDIRKRQGEEVF